MTRIALVTAQVSRSLDDDLVPLQKALENQGAEVLMPAWDDANFDWRSVDLALLRSTWDYTLRLPEFLAWIDTAATQTRLFNPPPVVRWNTDKHYLRDLGRAGVAVVPSAFIEPGEAAADKLDAFLAEPTDCTEFVVKPCVGAGSRDAQRYTHEERAAALTHAQRLLDAGRSVLLQPYLDRVDEHGETALIFFAGEFSLAIRKGPLLRRGEGPTRALFAAEHIMPRQPGIDELSLARATLAAMPFGALLYARVDVIQAADGTPRLLELELTEPSLFFDHAADSAQRFASAVLSRA